MTAGPRATAARGRRRGAATFAMFLGAAAIVFLGIPGGPVPQLAGPAPAQAQVTLPIPGLSTTTAAPSSTEAPSTTATPPESTPPEPTTAVTEAPSTDTSATDTTETTVPETSTEFAVAPATSAPPTVPRRRVVITAAPATSISAALTGSYGLAVATILVIAIGLFGFAVRATTGGGLPLTAMQRRWRLAAGFGCLGAAAIVGLIGYLRLSLEPAVNRQIPYLASAGMALVILAVAGGSLIVAEQMRGDDNRLDELEAAVRSLADTLSPLIEAPARHAGGSGPSEADKGDEAADDRAPATPPSGRRAR